VCLNKDLLHNLFKHLHLQELLKCCKPCNRAQFIVTISTFRVSIFSQNIYLLFIFNHFFGYIFFLEVSLVSLGNMQGFPKSPDSARAITSETGKVLTVKCGSASISHRAMTIIPLLRTFKLERYSQVVEAYCPPWCM
jgi:hypothetical protein